MYYKIRIHETGRNSLKEEPVTLNVEVKEVRTLEEVKSYLTDRYGKIPKRTPTNTTYQEPNATPIGFVYSYWNKDYSHNTKSWYQTDWVEVTMVVEKPILLN